MICRGSQRTLLSLRKVGHSAVTGKCIQRACPGRAFNSSSLLSNEAPNGPKGSPISKVAPSGPKGSLLQTDAPWSDLSKPQRIVKLGKMTGYSGVIILGLGLISTAIYFLGVEIVESNRDNRFYDLVLQEVKQNQRCQLVIGPEIMGPTEAKDWNTPSRQSPRSVAVQAKNTRYINTFRPFIVVSGFFASQCKAQGRCVRPLSRQR